jgi:hypothetical protein
MGLQRQLPGMKDFGSGMLAERTLTMPTKPVPADGRAEKTVSELPASEPHAFTDCGYSSFDPSYVIVKNTNGLIFVSYLSQSPAPR